MVIRRSTSTSYVSLFLLPASQAVSLDMCIRRAFLFSHAPEILEPATDLDSQQDAPGPRACGYVERLDRCPTTSYSGLLTSFPSFLSFQILVSPFRIVFPDFYVLIFSIAVEFASNKTLTTTTKCQPPRQAPNSSSPSFDR